MWYCKKPCTISHFTTIRVTAPLIVTDYRRSRNGSKWSSKFGYWRRPFLNVSWQLFSFPIMQCWQWLALFSWWFSVMTNAWWTLELLPTFELANHGSLALLYGLWRITYQEGDWNRPVTEVLFAKSLSHLSNIKVCFHRNASENWNG